MLVVLRRPAGRGTVVPVVAAVPTVFDNQPLFSRAQGGRAAGHDDFMDEPFKADPVNMAKLFHPILAETAAYGREPALLI